MEAAVISVAAADTLTRAAADPSPAALLVAEVPTTAVAVHTVVAARTVAVDTTVAAIIGEVGITAVVAIMAVACIWALASALPMLTVRRTAMDTPLPQLLAATMTSGVTGCQPRVLRRQSLPRIPVRAINSHCLWGRVGLTAPTRSEIM